MNFKNNPIKLSNNIQNPLIEYAFSRNGEKAWAKDTTTLQPLGLNKKENMIFYRIK